MTRTGKTESVVNTRAPQVLFPANKNRKHRLQPKSGHSEAGNQ